MPNAHLNPSCKPYCTQPYLELPPGSGPRHLVFQPATAGGAGDEDILFAWVANELSNDVTVLAHDPQSGHMQVNHYRLSRRYKKIG
jgi:6-phosphogluconolactonase (cycloisomerase 2 family)